LQSQVITEYGAALGTLDRPDPEPQASEVLLQVSHCGVCHSDVHLHDGFFDLGSDKKLDLSASHSLPFTLGHEIEGTVIALGPQVQDQVALGARRVVYPWIGCGECAVCARGDEQLCNTPQALGVNRDGGYSTKVIVPHPRYLLDYEGITPGLAATYMCSGLTAYSALKKIGPQTNPLNATESIAIIGLGGVGMMGLQCARVLFPNTSIIAVDVDDDKLQTALANGAAACYNASEPDAAKRLLKATGGVAAAVDFVGSESSLGFANRALRKGGKAVIVGLFGGGFSMPIPLFPLRAISLTGSYVGTLAETRELLELAKAGALQPIPIQQRPLNQANQTLDDLRAGRILGRVVLSTDNTHNSE
jgi:D-arabinose 1-dehydrogenase-like Zn-dependent alcohol dehydrogenase